jgi:hypothetical protein
MFFAYGYMTSYLILIRLCGNLLRNTQLEIFHHEKSSYQARFRQPRPAQFYITGSNNGWPYS